MHGPFGPQWHCGPGAHHFHWGYGHDHGPSREEREELIAYLERYQRDLEEETIAVATRIKELRAAGAPGTPGTPSRTQPSSQRTPPTGGTADSAVLRPTAGA
jgi:hypothetical protein